MIKKLLLAIGIIALTISAQGTGTAGDPWLIGSPTAANVTAVLEDGTLTISGTGAMKDWETFVSYVPWNDVKEEITSINIGDEITNIGDEAFKNCSGLTAKLTIPNSVITIGYFAFQNCSGLESVTIGNSVTSINMDAFLGCSELDTVVFMGSKPTTFGTNIFYNTGGVVLSCPYGDESWDGFSYDNVTEIIRHVPDTDGSDTWNIGVGADSANVTATLSNDTLTISGTGEMKDDTKPWYSVRTEITTLVIEDGITNISIGAFWNCSAIESVSIGNSVTRIGSEAFKECYSLAKITIPSGVESIGSYAFNYCAKLDTMLFMGNQPTGITSAGLSMIDDGVIISCPFGDESWDGASYYNVTVIRHCLNGHTYDTNEENWTDITAATCLAEGSATSSCLRDGCEATNSETLAIDENAHSAVTGTWTNGWSATCEYASSLVELCTYCSHTIATDNTAAFGHSWGDWTDKTTASCTQKATQERVCSHDGAHTETQEVGEPLGHDYTEIGIGALKSAATCTSPAIYRAFCSRGCGAPSETETIEDGEALGHSFPEIWTVVLEPTATELGKEERVCERNGCTEKQERDIDMTAINKTQKSDGRFGIKFASNIVSDKAEISVVLPNNERATQTKIAVYDMTGNVVFVGATALAKGASLGRPLTWDLRNSAGRTVANGTYLVIAEVKAQNGMTYHYSAKLGVKK